MNNNRNNSLYLKPFFEGNVSYFETGVVMEEEGEIFFLFPIKKVLDVCSYGQNLSYIEGVDFIITKAGALKRIKNSRIPFLKWDEYFLEEPNNDLVIKVDNNKVNQKYRNKFLAYGEGSTFTSKQICITYEHDEIWNKTKPRFQGEKIKRFLSKLQNKERPTMLFFGDSITAGCNASGTEFGGIIPPYMDSWPKLVVNKLEENFDSKINYINTAVCGKETLRALESLDEAVIKHNPDLVVIAFGMNDGSLSPNVFKERIQKMINLINLSNPFCEFILVSTTIPNPLSDWFHIEQTKYIDVLKEINIPNAAIVDMTNVHLDLLKRKKL